MSSIGHLIIGLAYGITLYYSSNKRFTKTMVFYFVIGSILPDTLVSSFNYYMWVSQRIYKREEIKKKQKNNNFNYNNHRPNPWVLLGFSTWRCSMNAG